MLNIQFEGWFQCRFATDPDPTNDPRGLSGPTQVVPGEPEFDRLIRLNDFSFARYPFEDAKGVTVTSVSYQQETQATHFLVGASVDLIDRPQFHQRNQITVPSALQSAIDPFHFQISKEDVIIRRTDFWDPTNPKLTFNDVFSDPAIANRRLNTGVIQSPEVAEQLGILNYGQYRLNRKAALEALLEETTDPVKRAGLEKRIRNIRTDKTQTGVMLAATQFLGLQAIYGFDINGITSIEDPGNKLGGEIGYSQNWPLSFWMGGYDVDTFFGYMKGTLSIPFYPRK
ncbi:MAG: hypothetical protein IPL92_17835 [Saprospiraceae bacterium]|nr:hypothetical protein [Candidatus Opimibacter iunctus]